MNDDVTIKGPWDRTQIAAFLATTRAPARIACNGASGYPVVASLWFAPEDGRIWCATKAQSRIAQLLLANPRCAFEIPETDSPYCGVRGQGEARIVRERGPALLATLVERYLDDPGSDFARWLLSQAEDEVAIEIAPLRVMTWDFRERMRQ